MDNETFIGFLGLRVEIKKEASGQRQKYFQDNEINY